MAGYQWRTEKNWKPFAKFGISTILTGVTGGPVPLEQQTSAQLAIGGGIERGFGRAPWFLRMGFDWYDRDAWYAGISIGFQFDRIGRRVVAESTEDKKAENPLPNVELETETDKKP